MLGQSLLEDAEERSLLVALATEDTIWDWNLKTNHIAFSAKIAKFGHHGWESEPSIKWWERHIHPDDREATLGALAWALSSGKKSFSLEYRFCKADGDFAYIYDRAFVIHDESGVAVRAIGAMIDVTELRLVKQSLQKTENQLALVCRLNAMGTMGAMIAHELSQPLTAATNFIRAARRLSASERAGVDAKLHSALEAAEDNTLRAGEIIRRLRELVAKGGTNGCHASIAQILDDSLSIGRAREQHRQIRFRIEVEPADLMVWADPIQVQQVVVNLVRNSVEALEATTSPEIIVRAARREKYAEISVQDNGSGIPKKVRDKIFSAILSAKSAGMGIGLSISRTIIEAQGGEIWLATAVPGLTDFRFTLPLFQSDA